MSISPTELTDETRAEIERHKYFLSEKVGHDVGWEAAEKDWIENYGPKTGPETHAPKGVGGFFKRLLTKAK